MFSALCGAPCPLRPLKKEGDGSFRPPPFSTVSTGRALRIRLKTRLKPVSGHEKTPETQAFREFWLEVTPGFEPGNEGFADPCLTTWLCHRVSENHYTIYRRSLSRVKCPLKRDEKVKQKMPCFFNKLFCVILCIFGITKRPPAKVPPVAYALSCYFRAIFVCYACVFLLNMNEREQHALRRHPLGQRRVRTAPA